MEHGSLYHLSVFKDVLKLFAKAFSEIGFSFRLQCSHLIGLSTLSCAQLSHLDLVGSIGCVSRRIEQLRAEDHYI